MVRIIAISTLFMFASALATEQKQPWQARSSEHYQNVSKTDIEKRSTDSVVATDLNSAQQLSEVQTQKSILLKATDITHPINHDIWVYDARTHLLEDYDHDNYYSAFKLTFDVDTVFSHVDLYARLYLGNGEIYREYHTTSVFHIDDTEGDDEFTVETELLNGYESWDYDVLIEVYEADTHQLVAVYDQLDDADLSYLPLESYDYEYSYSPNSQVSVSYEHGGTIDAYWLLLFIPLAAARRYNRASH